MGTPQSGPAKPIECPACGTPNDPKAAKCIQCGAALTEPQPVAPLPVAAPAPAQKGQFPLFAVIIGVAMLALVGGCIFFLVLSTRTTDLTGRVASVSWTRRVLVQELVPISGQDWRDQLPPGALVGSCSERQRGTDRQDTGQTREVCGTPYTVDTGSGFGEVKQDCETEPIYEEVPVYEDYCSFTATVWQTAPGPSLTGTDLNAAWPQTNLLRSNQREVGREESYEIVFRANDKTYTYTTPDFQKFQQFQIGSSWTLKVNSFDAVTSVEPLQ
ncbi:MAG: zinc ribbon domain-containing protein [Anaerolineales bacterium]|nr:zinc ribbon domain-containing protein [Anaerolineales bacterium]